MPDVKTIESIERTRNSVNGNPVFWIAFTDGTQARTSSDSAFAYEIGNPGLREGCSVTVELTRSGRIRDMRSSAK